jgi:hypothetical protein
MKAAGIPPTVMGVVTLLLSPIGVGELHVFPLSWDKLPNAIELVRPKFGPKKVVVNPFAVPLTHTVA